MLTDDAITYRSSVLLGNFVDTRPDEVAAMPLMHSERQAMTHHVDKIGGQTLDIGARSFCALFSQAGDALAIARQITRDVVH